MTLIELRKKIVDATGRYDLVKVENSLYLDNGLSYYMDAAQKYLELISDIKQSVQYVYLSLIAGQSYVILKDIKLIHNISVFYNNTWRNLSCIKDTKDFIFQYSDDEGEPIYYNVCNGGLRLNKNQIIEDGTIYDVEYDEDGVEISRVSFGTFPDLQMISKARNSKLLLLWKRPNQNCILRIVGIYAHTSLADNEDENFWSVNHADLLVQACVYQIMLISPGYSSAAINAIKDNIKATLYSIKCNDIEQDGLLLSNEVLK